MDDDIAAVLWSADDIARRVKQLGDLISKDFLHEQPLLLIGVATGAFVFLADLVRHLKLPTQVDLIRVHSYGNSTQSCGVATILTDVKLDVRGKHLLLVEDIVDTGVTLRHLVKHLVAMGASSVSVCTLLDKKARRKVELELPSNGRFYTGFECPDSFVVGYGMDFAEHYRGLPYVGVLKPHIYQESSH